MRRISAVSASARKSAKPLDDSFEIRYVVLGMKRTARRGCVLVFCRYQIKMHVRRVLSWLVKDAVYPQACLMAADTLWVHGEPSVDDKATEVVPKAPAS